MGKFEGDSDIAVLDITKTIIIAITTTDDRSAILGLV